MNVEPHRFLLNLLSFDSLRVSASLIKINTFSEDEGYVPNAQFILSIVRKGSLQMVKKGLCQDVQDINMIRKLKLRTSRSALISLCKGNNNSLPIVRSWRRYVLKNLHHIFFIYKL